RGGAPDPSRSLKQAPVVVDIHRGIPRGTAPECRLQRVRVTSLDMAEVRAKIAARKAAAGRR
ncbi:MAG: hypothetical protein ACXWD3_13200, partial [Mycobacterium sp.]